MSHLRAVVRHAYRAQNSDELNLKVGDVIDVSYQEKDGWWYGDMSGYLGWFPSNYVTLVSPVISDSLARRQSQSMARVEYDYQAKDSDEITLKKGHYVSIIRQNDSGWWIGEMDGKVGLFPSNFVVLCGIPKPMPNLLLSTDMLQNLELLRCPMNSDTKPEKREQEVPMSPGPLSSDMESFLCKATVLSSRAAQTNDELPLFKGDIIKVYEKGDNDWWKGESFGRKGWFPANYVTEIVRCDSNASGTSQSCLKSFNEANDLRTATAGSGYGSESSPQKRTTLCTERSDASSVLEESERSIGSIDHSPSVLKSRSSSIFGHGEDYRGSCDFSTPESPRSDLSKHPSMEMPNLIDLRRSLKPIPRKNSKTDVPLVTADQPISNRTSRSLKCSLDAFEPQDCKDTGKPFKDIKNENETMSPSKVSDMSSSWTNEIFARMDQLRKEFETRLEQEQRARLSLEQELRSLRKYFIERNM